MNTSDKGPATRSANNQTAVESFRPSTSVCAGIAGMGRGDSQAVFLLPRGNRWENDNAST